MLLPILFAALILAAQQASMHCVDTGAETATAQTQPLPGPGGASAVLKVSTADDHSKNSHECNAEYQLLITPAGGRKAIVVDLNASDAEYDRIISLRLDGFSQDGKRIFGILSEAGKYPLVTLFAYNTIDGQVQLVDLKKQFIRAVECQTTFDVVGTTEAGSIAVELNSSNGCVPKRRYLLNPTKGRVQRLQQGVPIQSLYNVAAR